MDGKNIEHVKDLIFDRTQKPLSREGLAIAEVFLGIIEEIVYELNGKQEREIR